MICISIESFKLLLNEIQQIENKNSFIIIIICKDAHLSKGAFNEASQDRQLHPLRHGLRKHYFNNNNSNIPLLFPSDTFMEFNLAGALRQAIVCTCTRNSSNNKKSVEKG